MVVPDSDTGNLPKHIEQDVPICIDDVVAVGLVVVGYKDMGPGVLEGADVG